MITKGLLQKGLSIVLAESIIIGISTNFVYVNANEQNNIIGKDNDIINLDDAEKIAWYHVLSTVSLGDNTGMWTNNMFIKDEQEIYNVDNIIASYCIEYTNNENEDCGYVVVGASESYAPIIEYATNGSFCSQDIQLYYLGNGDINYYIRDSDNNLRNISGDDNVIIERNEIKAIKFETEQENYSDEWGAYYDFDKDVITDSVKKAEEYAIEIASSNPPTVGGAITSPSDFESGYSNYEAVDVPNYNLNRRGVYFSTSNFYGNGNCVPTAATNLMLYWYCRSSAYDSLCYNGSWDSTFSLLYKLMKTDDDGTSVDNATNGIIEYLNIVGKHSVVDLYNPSDWNNMSTEIKSGYPFLFEVYDHYRYSDHAVLALGYVVFTYSTVQASTGMVYSRYLRIVDGWDRTCDRYIHVRVGHTYSERDMIRVRI